MVSLRSLVIGVALIAAPVMAAIPLNEVISGIRRLTAITDVIQDNADSITVLNAPLLLLGQGPFPACLLPSANLDTLQVTHEQKIIADLNELGSSATALATAVSNSSPVGSRDANSVNVAFSDFVYYHQILAQTLSDKANILVKVAGIGQPVANALRNDKNGIDAAATRLSAYAGPAGPNILLGAYSVRTILDEAISKYSALL